MFYKLLSKAALSACVAAGFACSPASAETVSTSLRSELRAAMVDYIDANSVDGMYFHLDPANGTVVTYEPVEVFAVVLKVGAHFVICSSFDTADGKTVYLDFLAIHAEGEARVLEAFAEKRHVTRKMVRAHQEAEG